MRTQTLFEMVTHSPEETVACGRKLAGALGPRCLVMLEGELGSGKTTLVKGIVAGLGVAREEEVKSPTFALVHEYGTPADDAGQAARETRPGPARKVYHVDLYRIEEPSELSTLGLEDLMADDATVVVEWGEKLRDLGRASRVRVRLEHLGSDDRRIVVERLEA